jgi:ABC-type phosphate transport system substrate-binding protein
MLVVAALTALSSFGSSTARAVGPRTLTVTPAAGLGNQVALAQWSGFDPTVGAFTDTVTLLQCKLNPKQVSADHNPANADDCLVETPFPNYGNEIQSAVTQSNGTGSAFIEILPAAQQPLLACSQTNPCTLLAYENNGVPPPTNALPATAATATINFAKSIADCPPVTNYDVRAEGEASASQLVYNWAANLCTANPKLILDYTETSSISGREDFLNKLVDIGVTSIPPTSAELAASPGYPQYTYAPIDVSAVVVAYNMDDPTTGKQITDMVMSPRLLARVISDTTLTDPPTNPDSFFADPELNRLNPSHHWPDESLSQPLLRAEKNADTYLATDWIAHDANAEKFLQGNDPDGVVVNGAWKDVSYPTDIFENLDPSDNAYVPIQGEGPVVRKTFYGVKPAETTPNSPRHIGFISVLDLATAERYQLPVAKLVNAAGSAVAPDAAGIAAGYAAMKTNPDGITKYPDFSSTNSAAYPLVKVDYAMVPTQVPNATVAANLKRLLTFIAGPGQSTLPVGYLPLPADLQAQDLAAAAKITVAPSSKKPGTTTTTTVPGATTTTTTLASASNFGSVGGNGNSNGAGSATTAPAGSTGPQIKTAAAKPATGKKVSYSTPVVDITSTGERYGLPIIAALAVLAGLYPLSRRGRPLVGRTVAAVKTRIHRSAQPPPVGSAP